MTDNEIIKALACCVNGEDCQNCPLQEQFADCKPMTGALDLINRQKAEIERLKEDKDTFESVLKKCFLIKFMGNDPLAELKSEAIKEFAERLKEIYQDCKFVNIRNVNARRFNERVDYCIDVLNNLVKEMVGEQRKEDERK